MNISTHRIRLDVAEAASHCAVSLRQGENAHRLEISLTDHGLPYHISGECYAVFAAKKSDGTQLLNDCSVVNDTVIYDLTAQTTAAPGRLDCELRLYGASDKLIIAPKFSMFVEDSAIDEDGIESSDEFSALNELISQAASAAAFRLKGYFETTAGLAGISSPAAGEAYGIGTEPPYEIYVWDEVNNEWVNHGTLQGDRGERGLQGSQGIQGERGEPGVSGVYVGSGTAPAAYNVQIDPNGDAIEPVEEAPADGKQYARQNGEWAEVKEGNVDGLKKQVTALKNLLEGVAYSVEEDTAAAYSKSVPSGAQAVSVNSFGGKSEAVDGEIISAEVVEIVSKKQDSTVIGTITVPSALLAFLADKGYGWSAGTAYNEVDFEHKKYIQRVGMLTLNVDNMNNSEDYPGWRNSGIAQFGHPTAGSSLSNILFEYGTEASYNTRSGNDIFFLSISIYGLTQSEWKEQYAGQTFHFIIPFATPVEYDISDYLPEDEHFNFLLTEPGGSLTFEQENDTQLEVPQNLTWAVKNSEVTA